jgi:hypothetical protein
MKIPMMEQLATMGGGIESAVRRSQEELIMFVWGGPSLVLLTALYQVWRASRQQLRKHKS